MTPENEKLDLLLTLSLFLPLSLSLLYLVGSLNIQDLRGVAARTVPLLLRLDGSIGVESGGEQISRDPLSA